jgi:hypothetical protein
LINELGEVVISDFDYDDLLYVIDDNHIVVTKKGLGSGIISKNNHKITEMMFEFKPSELFSKEFFRASYKGKVGFINKDGNPLIIDKKGLNIPETKLDFDFLSVVDELRWLLP